MALEKEVIPREKKTDEMFKLVKKSQQIKPRNDRI